MYRKLKGISTFIAGIAIASTLQTAHADWNVSMGELSVDSPQDVVITMKADPRKNTEQACLAVTFARAISGYRSNANVTLFVTLDGVSLAKKKVINKRRLMCTTPWGEVSLKESLETFIGENDNAMVVCPICWMERYGEKLPDYGVLPGKEGTPGDAIMKLILNADKILDF